jgi:hypothetical protein
MYKAFGGPQPELSHHPEARVSGRRGGGDKLLGVGVLVGEVLVLSSVGGLN